MKRMNENLCINISIYGNGNANTEWKDRIEMPSSNIVEILRLWDYVLFLLLIEWKFVELAFAIYHAIMICFFPSWTWITPKEMQLFAIRNSHLREHSWQIVIKNENIFSKKLDFFFWILIELCAFTIFQRINSNSVWFLQYLIRNLNSLVGWKEIGFLEKMYENENGMFVNSMNQFYFAIFHNSIRMSHLRLNRW